MLFQSRGARTRPEAVEHPTSVQYRISRVKLSTFHAVLAIPGSACDVVPVGARLVESDGVQLFVIYAPGTLPIGTRKRVGCVSFCGNGRFTFQHAANDEV
jgi:hypothetical protein